jgi:RNA 2',3'-cyclic 3'-phosphodiesterase
VAADPADPASTRLFVAVDLDDAVRMNVAATIDALRERLERRRGSPRVRWMTADRLHLTLLFIGYVPVAAGRAIDERLAARFDAPSFDLALGGLGTFPATGGPRVVWLGVTEGAAALQAVAREVATRLEDVEFRREDRPFSPHLTLGRFKERGHAADRDALLAEPVRPAGRCRVDRVTLYQSRLSSLGPTYVPLRTTPLAKHRQR